LAGISATKSILLILLLSIANHLSAQTLPVGLLENVEDSYRRQQLLGDGQTKTCPLAKVRRITASAALEN
jgi:hypothetical protein